ncbi:MAG: hypothetical protein M3R24_15870 [Chloroflexota bacterium]|nr:hypothetical protein [Chloroflexota bacterium]
MSNFGTSGAERQQLSDQVQTTIAEMKQALTKLPPNERVIAFGELKDWVNTQGAGYATETGIGQ